MRLVCGFHTPLWVNLWWFESHYLGVHFSLPSCLSAAGWMVGRTADGTVESNYRLFQCLLWCNQTVLLFSFHFNEGLEERPSQDTTCIFRYMCTFIKFFLVHYSIFKLDFSCVNHHTHLCGWCCLYNYTLKTSDRCCSEEPQKVWIITWLLVQRRKKIRQITDIFCTMFSTQAVVMEMSRGRAGTIQDRSIDLSIQLSIHLSMAVSNYIFMQHPLISIWPFWKALSLIGLSTFHNYVQHFLTLKKSF